MGYIMELRKLVGPRPLIMAGSCVLVFNEEGHLLLQKRTDSLDWGTLGGSMEPGESLEETAARELYEEAGLRAESFKLISIFQVRTCTISIHMVMKFTTSWLFMKLQVSRAAQPLWMMKGWNSDILI